eukprot:TRINITY_DN4038_c0_g1_i3.p1 TRINITY_DN4038_c0_g1~~TRINITY_DN4038_c0_g1_i3.p1  ORF type:complete len:1676 (+),score=537.61 TRINITY_DN4038_c0_g1_i3:314-5029(+)
MEDILRPSETLDPSTSPIESPESKDQTSERRTSLQSAGRSFSLFNSNDENILQLEREQAEYEENRRRNPVLRRKDTIDEILNASSDNLVFALNDSSNSIFNLDSSSAPPPSPIRPQLGNSASASGRRRISTSQARKSILLSSKTPSRDNILLSSPNSKNSLMKSPSLSSPHQISAFKEALKSSGIVPFLPKTKPNLPPPPEEFTSGAFKHFAAVGIPMQTLHETVRTSLLSSEFSGKEVVEGFSFTSFLEANESKILSCVPPEDKKDSILQSLTQFCFPNGITMKGTITRGVIESPVLKDKGRKTDYNPQDVSIWNFVLTNIDGDHFNSCVLVFHQSLDITISKKGKGSEESSEGFEGFQGEWNVSLLVPHAICLVSRWPYFSVLKECMMQIFRQCEEMYIKSGFVNAESLVSTLIQLPVPKWPVEFSWGVNLLKKTVQIPSIPSHNHFPLVDFSLRYLFLTLDVSKVIQLMSAIMLERQILFVSSSYTLLCLSSEAILSLLYPFVWFHVYVPVLPPTLVDYIQAPTPFIMGLHRNLLPNSTELISEVDIVDLDAGIIRWGGQGPPIPFPEKESTKIISAIRPLIHPQIFNLDSEKKKTEGNESTIFQDPFAVDSETQKLIRVVFFEGMVSLLSDYTKFYMYNPPSNMERASSVPNFPISSSKSTPQNPLSPQEWGNSSMGFRSESVGSLVSNDSSTFSPSSPPNAMNGSPAFFRKSEYICSRSEDTRNFLEAFMETQAWILFENDRNPLFDESCLLHSNGNSIGEFLLSRFCNSNKVFLAPKILPSKAQRRDSPLNISALLGKSQPDRLSLSKLGKGFHFYGFDSELCLKNATNMEPLLGEISSFIHGERNRISPEEESKLVEYYYARATLNIKTTRIFAALQDIEHILEISPEFPLEEPLIEYLHNALEELENNPMWLQKTRQALMTVGPGIRRKITDYGNQKPAVLERRNSQWNTHEANAAGEKEDLALELKMAEIVEPGIEQLPSFLQRVAYPNAIGSNNNNNPMITKRKILNKLDGPKLMKEEEFLQYCGENTWPFPKDTITSFFELVAKKTNGKMLLNYQLILQAFREVKQRKPHLLTNVNLYDEDEPILMNTGVTTALHKSAKGISGQLFLTSKRLIYLAKKQGILNESLLMEKLKKERRGGGVFVNARSGNEENEMILPLGEVFSAESHLILQGPPPGIPCVKLVCKKKGNTCANEFVYAFSDVVERDHWYRILNEMSMVFRMSLDLSDTSIINDVMLHILITEIVYIVSKKRVKTFLQHHRSLNWLNIKQTLERNALNVSLNPDSDEKIGGWEYSEKLLMLITQIFFSSLMQNETDKMVELDLRSVESSAEYEQYLVLVRGLRNFDLNSLVDKSQVVSFFVNIYNALVIHAYLTVGFTSNKWEWRYIARCAWYQIGCLPYTLDFIHHGILRANHPNPWINSGESRFLPDDPRFGKLPLPHKPDQRIVFALCTHNETSPYLRVMRPDTIEEILDMATSEYVEGHVRISSSERKITLPKLFKWYKADFSEGSNHVLDFIKPYLSNSLEFRTLMFDNDDQRKRSTLKIIFQYNWFPSPKPFRQFL